MAHRRDSCLRSQSSHSQTLRVPLDSEEHLAPLETIIENQDLAALVEAKEGLSGINSNFNGCQVRDEGQQQGQEKPLRCGEGSLSNIATCTVAHSKRLPSPLEVDLHDVIHDCEMLNQSLIEDYSVVGSCTETIVGNMKPNCKGLYHESNLHFVDQGHDTMKNVTSSEGFCTDESLAEKHIVPDSEQKEVWKDAQERMEVKDADQLPAVSPSASEVEQTKDCMSEKKEEKGCFGEREELCTTDERIDLSAVASGSSSAVQCNRKDDEPNITQNWEGETCVLHGNLPPGAAEKVYTGNQDRGQQQEVEMEKSMDAEQVYDTSQSDFCKRDVAIGDNREEWVPAEKQLSTVHGDICLDTFENETEDPSSENILVNEKELRDQSSTTVSFSDHSEGFLENEVMSSSTQGSVNLQDINISDYQDSDKKLNDCNIDFGSDSVALCNSEPQSQTVDDWISPIKETATRSVFKDDQTFQDPHPDHKKSPYLFKDDIENVREAFQEKGHAKDLPFLNVCYGEPLSRQDSVSETESKCKAFSNHQVEGEYTDVNKMEGEYGKDIKDPASQVKVLKGISRNLQPVVLLKSLEPRNNCKVEEFLCAVCKHAELKVNNIIDHYCCNHCQHKLQLCASCNAYLTNTDLAKEHVCGIANETLHISSESPLKSRGLTLPAVYKCRYCFQMFPHPKELNQHEQSHQRQSPFKCNRCGHCFSQKCGLNKHKLFVKCQSSCSQIRARKMTERNTVQNPKSVKPQTDIPTEEALGNLTDCFVKLVDVYKTNVCNICFKSFTLRGQLKKHKYNVHQKKVVTSFTHAVKSSTQEKVPRGPKICAKFKCPICPRMFKYSYNRARHLREQCIREFTLQSKGRIDKKFQCPLCHAIFLYSSNRTKHIKRKCLKQYNSKNLRTKSKHIKNMQQKEKKSAPLKTSFQKKVFHCVLCPATYAHYSGLFRHKKKHELYKLSGKVIRFRNSSVANLSKVPDTVTEDTSLLKKDRSLPISCQVCGKNFMTLFSLNKHLHVHRRKAQMYSCLECGKTFKTEDHLLSHQKVHQRKIQCTVCRKIFPNIKELIQHRPSHDKKGLLQCPDCAVQFHHPSLLLKHVTTHKCKTENLQLKQELKNCNQIKCPLCEKVFQDVRTLLLHCLKHSAGSKSPQCPFCKRHFTQRQSMRRHMTMHIFEKPFPCQICKKRFYRKEYALTHQEKCLGHTVKSADIDGKDVEGEFAVIASQATSPKAVVHEGKEHEKHRQKKKMTCSYCPRVFTRVGRLAAHHKSHKLNMLVPCTQCHQFFGRNKFKAHICQVISYACKYCGKPFARKCNRVLHEKTCTPPNKNGMGIDKLLLKCPQCPRRFRYRCYLLRHLPSHTRVQYACMHCGQIYTNQSRYLQHEAFCNGANQTPSTLLNLNTNELPSKSDLTEANHPSQADFEDQYKCKFCTKAFMKSRNLRRHILTHTEVNPYRCKACDGCFSRHDHLKLHQMHCKGKRQRLELCIAKVSLEDVGRGWQNKQNLLKKGQQDTFHCSSCSKHFSSQSNLRRHVSMSHVSVKPFRCNGCGKFYTLEKTLKKHKRNRCCMKSTQAAFLQQRLVTENIPNNELNRALERFQHPLKNKRKYVCKYCPRTLKSSEQLKIHTRLHTGDKPFGCDNCGERFIRRDYLKRHLLKCNLIGERLDMLGERCGMAFSTDTIGNHLKACPITSSENRLDSCGTITPPSPPNRGFPCANCNARFLLFSQLQLHFLNVHKEEANLNSPKQALPLHQHLSNVANVKEEPLDDRYGNSNLSTNDNLAFIENANSDIEVDKPFSCTLCQMRFIRKGDLSMHMSAHLGRFPFKCKRCKKGFWGRSQHRRHVAKCRHSVSIIKDECSIQCDAEITSEMGLSENDSVLVFNQGSKTTGTGVLQTNFSCKDDLKDKTQELSRNPRKESLMEKTKAVQYQCSECDLSFTDGLLLISHLEDHGRQEHEQKLAICRKCGKKCTSSKNLERHMKMHGSEYSCPECPKIFFYSSDLDIHRSYHDPNRPFACGKCNQRFWTSQSLDRHDIEDHSEILTCQFCQSSFTAKSSLVRHCRMMHKIKVTSDSGPVSLKEKRDASNEDDTSNETEGSGDNDSDSAPYFPCHVCSKTFFTSENLEDHQRCHLGEKPHECAECGKCFFQAAQLQQHQRSHTSEFQCQTCGRGFVSLFALRKHKHTHGRKRPHRCPKCLLSFTGHSQLAEHMATHCDDNFPCDICDETFSCRTSRAEHRKVHTEPESGAPFVIPPQETTIPSTSSMSISAVEDMKYRCGVCSDRFKDPEQLSEHGCMAAIERSYSCLQCNKHFLHGSHLKKHQLSVHQSQSYMYLCDQCHMSFAYHKHYINHLKKHTADLASSNALKMLTEKIFKCPICPLSFDHAVALSSHLSIHSKTVHKCRICKLPYSSKSKLAEHERCHLTTATEYECTECAQTFLGSDTFRQHQCSRRQRADTDSEFSHPSTSKSSATLKQAVEEEEVDVGQDFFNCVDCPSTFSSKPSLLEHLKKHQVIFKCELCGKTFNSKKYLNRHRRRHQKKMENMQSKASLLMCSLCSKVLHSKQDLQMHMRMHAEQTVGHHRCDMCYKSFGHLSLLRHHQESHIGQVVYECTECDKAFAFPNLLDQHQKTHTVPNI